MSKKQLKIEIYKTSDFKKSNRLDKIRMHMIEPDRFELNQDDFEYYQKLQQTYQLAFNEVRQSVAIRLIQDQVPGAESWHTSNRLYREVYDLFAPFTNVNKAVRRSIIVEKLYMMATIAETKAIHEDGDVSIDLMQLASNLYIQAAKIEGLDKHEENSINADDIQIPDFEITSDPSAFLAAQVAADNEDEDE